MKKLLLVSSVFVVTIGFASLAEAQGYGRPYGYARPSGHSAGYYGSRAVFYSYGAALGAAGYVYRTPPPPGYMGQAIRGAVYNARQFVNPQVWRPTRRVYRHVAYGR